MHRRCFRQSSRVGIHELQHIASTVIVSLCDPNQHDDALRRIENMFQYSALLLSQLVWILLCTTTLSAVEEKVSIPVPIVVEPSQSCM